MLRSKNEIQTVALKYNLISCGRLPEDHFIYLVQFFLKGAQFDGKARCQTFEETIMLKRVGKEYGRGAKERGDKYIALPIARQLP